MSAFIVKYASYLHRSSSATLYGSATMRATRHHFYLNARHTLVAEPFTHTAHIQPSANGMHAACTIRSPTGLGHGIGAADPSTPPIPVGQPTGRAWPPTCRALWAAGDRRADITKVISEHLLVRTRPMRTL
jgi:hypothetical protein